MHLHILGICGTFMGGVAALAREAGHRVTGCDANVYPPMSTQLAAQGIELTPGFAPEQLETVARGADVHVVGNVVSRGNPLIEAVLDGGLPYVSGPQWLAENVLAGRWVLAVAGTHGKTTTTAMLAWILDRAGLSPGFLVGGVPANFEVSARLSSSPFFVIEADEYDTAFFDKRSKFVHYRPRTAVLNNLEFDHADIFPDLAAIETQFHHLVRTVPASGRLLVNGDEAALGRVLARGCWSEVERFGARGSGTGASARGPANSPGRTRVAGAVDSDVRPAARPVWEVDDEGLILWRGEPQGRLALEMPGRHNRMNALAALAAAHHAGVPVGVGLEALRDFAGIRRRMELRGAVGGVSVYDDFAHHPTAIAATIEGLRATMEGGRILAVIEPRSNTMKLGVMKDRLPVSLAGSDVTFCYSRNLGWDPTVALAPLGERARVHDDLGALAADVVGRALPGDRVVVMSNGGFGAIHERLLAGLASRFAR